MSIYYPYFLITLVIGTLGMEVPNLSLQNTKEYQMIRKKSRLFTILICLIVVIFSSFRMISAPSIDEYAYRNRFLSLANLDFLTAINDTTEPIFTSIVWLSTRLFNTDQGVIIVTGLLTVVLLFSAIKKYSSDYAFACVILFVSGNMYNTFNGIQQYLSAVVMLFAFDTAYNKRFKSFFLIVIICTLIHNASIFLLLFYPLANTKTGSIKMWVYNVAFLVGGLLFYRAVPFLAENYGVLTEYVNILTTGHYGVQTITILINMVPAFFALICRNNLQNDKVTSSFANITILHAMIYLLAGIDTYIARLAIFTAPFTVIFLSRIMRYVKDSSIIKLLAILLYSVVCFLQLQGILYFFNFAF